MHGVRRQLAILLSSTILLALPTACARRTALMNDEARGAALAAAPADKAVIVFLRPAYTGYAISAAVYEDDRFLGIVMRQARLVHETTPGTHRYMVVSEAADFLDADLEAGKTYFVNVRPRMGAWRARFSLYPITPTSPNWSELSEWLDKSYVVTPNAAGEQWARDNQGSVTAKRDKYLRAWLAKATRPTLRPTDGVVRP
jgi:hypothetical protein